jgi:hypothetical protein
MPSRPVALVLRHLENTSMPMARFAEHHGNINRRSVSRDADGRARLSHQLVFEFNEVAGDRCGGASDVVAQQAGAQ